MAVHVCFCVHVHVQAQLAPPYTCGSEGKLWGAGGSHSPAWLNPDYGPSGKTKRKKKESREIEKRREEVTQRKEEMKGDLWVLFAKGFPIHKPMGLDYKTKLLLKRVLFFHSCVVGATVGGSLTLKTAV